MPGSVKTERDEHLWNEAKKAVRSGYPDVAEDSDRFWALVQGIYQRMNGKRGKTATKASSLRLDPQGRIRRTAP